MEEEVSIKKNEISIGDSLDSLSVEELLKLVKNLHKEIDRVEKEIRKKKNAKSSADKYFQ